MRIRSLHHHSTCVTSTAKRALCLLAGVAAALVPLFAQSSIPPAGLSQIQALLQEKSTRNAAQLKLDSQILYSSKTVQGQAVAVGVVSLPSALSALEVGPDGLIHVDIEAAVNPGLLAAITALGGRVESSFPQYNAVRGWLPLLVCETIAGRADVSFVRPADRGATSAQGVAQSRMIPRGVREARLRAQLEGAMPALKSRKQLLPRLPAFLIGPDTNGVKAHGADIVQGQGYTGSGVKIGVMSDGVDSLAAEQAAGRLPGTVTVLSGQAGSGDEGTAMLEIVYSMAPGAQLFYATAATGQAAFANNITALRSAGCDIIVDDFTYFAESAFQDGTVAKAVNGVVAGGGLYFSDAANSGNLDSGQSGTWEGDYVDSGVATSSLFGESGKLHSFGVNTYDTVTQKSQFNFYGLQWSDAWGASCNDYDLFLLDPTGTSVVAASTNVQNCSQNPIEFFSGSGVVNMRVVIVNFGNGTGNAQPRYLRIDTERGRLSLGTAGNTFGHNAGASTLTVAAANVASAAGGIFVGGTANPPETFSSDGPRRIFFDANGIAITPSCFLASCNGGTVLAKVDFTAADGVSTGVSGFSPFFGTSAAAPHAAAIAALVKSVNPSLTPAQIVNAMKTTALPVSTYQARTVGVGIVMANRAVNSVLAAPTIAKAFNPTSILSGSTSAVTLTLSNGNTTALTGASFSDTLTNMTAAGGAVTGTCSGITPSTLAAGTTALAFSGITIPGSGSCTVTFSVISRTVGVLPNTTSGVTTTQTPTAGVPSNTATLTVTPALPTIAKAFNPTSIRPGATSTVTLTLSNSNTFALTGAAFSDTLVNMSAAGGNVTGSCNAAPRNPLLPGQILVSFAGITIPADGSCTVVFDVTSGIIGVQPNTTSGVTSTQTPTPGPPSNTANLTVGSTSLAAPTIVKAFSPTVIQTGGTSVVTLVLTNSNPSALTGGAFTDNLVNMRAVGGSVGGTCTGTTPSVLTAGQTALSFTGINIPLNASCTVTFAVTSNIAGSLANTTSGVTTTQMAAGPPSNTANLFVTGGSR